MNKYLIITVVLVLLVGGIFLFKGNVIGNVVKEDASNAPVKEFAMTSFYDNTGIWFSLKEIVVNRGDLVRIKVTNIKGNHDFVIDEYGVKQLTPLNEEVTIEFIADKVGEFEYYCSVPGHRQKGQWGKLKVVE